MNAGVLGASGSQLGMGSAPNSCPDILQASLGPQDDLLAAPNGFLDR